MMATNEEGARCKNYEKCSQYAEMVMDWTAQDCHSCPAYEKKNKQGEAGAGIHSSNRDLG